MKGKTAMLLGSLAALSGMGWLYYRNKPAEAEEIEDKGSETNPYSYTDGWQGSGYYNNVPTAESALTVIAIATEDDYDSYQAIEPPVIEGTVFQNLQAIYPAVLVKGQDFIITVMFNYRGDGGVFNIGAILPVGASYVSSQSWTLPPSEDLAGWAVDLWFSGGPLSSLPAGTQLDIFSFVSKPGILFSPDAAAQMEITRWDQDAMQMADSVPVGGDVSCLPCMLS